MEEELDEILLPTETQGLATVRHYGLLLFLAVSVILMLITLAAFIKS